MDGRENQRSSQMWCRNEQELSFPEPRTARTSEQNGSRGGRGKGIRGPRSFVPVGATNRDKRGAFLSRFVAPTGTKVAQHFVPVEASNRDKRPPFVPVGVSNRDKTPWPSYPLPFPPARAIQLTCSCCSWLGREEFLLISSPHL